MLSTAKWVEILTVEEEIKNSAYVIYGKMGRDIDCGRRFARTKGSWPIIN